MKNGFIIGPFKRENDLDSEVFKKHTVFLKNLEKIYAEKVKFEKADENYQQKEKGVSLIQRIKNDINIADVIIADIAGSRPCVLYELGLAHYLHSDKTIIVTQNKIDIPSDLKSFPCYDYMDAEDVTNLHNEIESKIQKNNSKDLKIGISQYPELMLLYNGIEKGYFKGLNIEIDIFKWNNLVDALNGSDVDAIIANKDLINKKNDTYFRYIFSSDVFKYSSFYIFSRNTNSLKSFQEIKQNSSPGVKYLDILFETFNQFNKGYDVRVLASKETDHFETFTKLNSYFGNSLIEKTFVIGDDSPHELFNAFLEETGDIYVGGIPERISLEKSTEKFKLIIESNDIKQIVKDWKQQNVIAYKKEKLKGSFDFEEVLIHKFILGWRKIFIDLKTIARKLRLLEAKEDDEEITKLKQEIDKYISYYNQGIEDNLKISVDDFLVHYINSNKLIQF